MENKAFDEAQDIVVAGHSHTVAMVGRTFAQEPSIRSINGFANLYSLDGPWPRTEAYWAKMVDHAKEIRVALSWNGNEHNLCYFFQAAFEFDFLSSHVPKIIRTLQILPRELIRKRFAELSIAELERRLTDMDAKAIEKIVLLGTPPPKRDNTFLREQLAKEPYFIAWAEQIGESIDSIKITMPHVRLKLWFLLQDMVRGIAKKFSIPYIDVPRAAQDHDGFLLEKYWESDVTHANAEYGHIMLHEIWEKIAH